MNEALIIFNGKVTLDQLIDSLKGELEFDYVDSTMISHEENQSLERFISFDLDIYAVDIYKEEGIELFADSTIYGVHFRDFDLFKKCISHIGKLYEIIVDNDHGRIIRDYRDVLKISDYRQFISELP